MAAIFCPLNSEIRISMEIGVMARKEVLELNTK